MTNAEAHEIAIREVTRQLKAVTFNFMADPRAAEIRRAKMADLTEALNILAVVQFVTQP